MRLQCRSFILTAAIVIAPGAAAQGPGKFVATGAMSVPRVGHSATALLNGQVLIAGGAPTLVARGVDDSGSAWDTAELYDPETGHFHTVGRMTAARVSHTATLLPNGKVLIAGGAPTPFYRPGSIVLSSCEIYDPATNTFSPAPPLTVPRMWHRATLLNSGKILITGGVGMFSDGSGPDTRWANAELYDAAAQTSVPTGSMSTERFSHTTELLPDGRVLVASGWGREDGAIPELEVYEPTAGTFRVVAAEACLTTDPGCVPYTTGSVGPRIASLLPNGTVLLGMHHYDIPSRETRIFDPVSSRFGAAADMRAARYVNATLLPSGLVLMTQDLFVPEGPGADLYDPASNTIFAAAEMLAMRSRHTATLIPGTGMVLIAGGIQSTRSALASAEIYIPEDPMPSLDLAAPNLAAGR
jgi:hypothetical protein